MYQLGEEILVASVYKIDTLYEKLYKVFLYKLYTRFFFDLLLNFEL